MTSPAIWRARTLSTVVLAGLGIAFTLTSSAAIAQDPPAATAASQLVARLKKACESDTTLRGVLLQGDELRGGVLSLTGTIDRVGQVDLIEGAATQLLDDSPAWKAQIPGGVNAKKMIVFPIRSDILPRLQDDFARAGAGPAGGPEAVAKIDPAGRPELFRQTRIDDLFFDSQGRLRFAGLCVSEAAYFAFKSRDTKPGDDPRTKIALGIRERLKEYPVPDKVDRAILSRVVAEKMRFEENPVRRLQNFANEAKLDNVLFWEAQFDKKGELVFEGLLGTDDERTQAAEFVARPEIVKTYAHPDQSPPAKAEAAVAKMAVVPWRTTLLAGLQKRFSGEANRKGTANILRHCRIDRASFIYPVNAGLKLRFEGVTLLAKGAAVGPVVSALRAESSRSFVVPIPVKYDPKNDLTVMPSPLYSLQSIIASNPELDGVRLDDVVFGAEGETTLEGLWIGPAQSAAFDAAVAPALVEQTRGKVRGPLARRLTEAPTDGLLRSLRGKVFASSDETSLQRLFFRPAADPVSRPEVVLQGATLAARLAEVRAQLTKWLNDDPLSKVVGAPVVELTPRETSLVAELRKLVVKDPALDGVRIDHGGFDEADTFVLSGRQDHKGQAEEVVALTGKAAAIAWKDLAPPRAAQTGTFAVRPISSVLTFLSRKLPGYAEASGVSLDRAFYNDASELVLAGRVAGDARDTSKLKKRIQSLLADEPGIKLGPLSLKPQPIDAEAAGKIVGRGIIALANGKLENFDRTELDDAILLNPQDSTAWYLRGVYYYLTRDQELAIRDLGRAHSLERASPAQRSDRFSRLQRFQGSLRSVLEDLLEGTPR